MVVIMVAVGRGESGGWLREVGGWTGGRVGLQRSGDRGEEEVVVVGVGVGGDGEFGGPPK